MTATIHALPVMRLDTAQQLREIADRIDSGEFGDVFEGVLTFVGRKGCEIQGIGLADRDGILCHYLLARAQRKLERVEME